MATTIRCRALRYARNIIARRDPALDKRELNLAASARVNGSLLALARINLGREKTGKRTCAA